VIDASNPRFPDQVEVVDKQLRELDLDKIPCLRVLNKVDLVDDDFVAQKCKEYRAVALSALNAKTFGPFLEAAQKTIGISEPLKTSVKQTLVS
jgi:GTP-binding protein HflX